MNYTDVVIKNWPATGIQVPNRPVYHHNPVAKEWGVVCYGNMMTSAGHQSVLDYPWPLKQYRATLDGLEPCTKPAVPIPAATLSFEDLKSAVDTAVAQFLEDKQLYPLLTVTPDESARIDPGHPAYNSLKEQQHSSPQTDSKD